MSGKKILIVDDEMPIRLALKTAFVRESMQAEEAACGGEALALLLKNRYDLVILDIMLQDMDGFSVLQQMRSNGILTPVLILSGKQEETDQVLGLGLGADDYLTKPFHLSVLIQKVKALIRRNSVYDQQKPNGFLERGPFRFDMVRLECSKNGEVIPFTARELALFRLLLEHPDQVFTKEELYRNVWNENIVDDNTIMVYIKRIREKVEEDPKKPDYVRTVRGIGYVFHVNQ